VGRAHAHAQKDRAADQNQNARANQAGQQQVSAAAGPDRRRLERLAALRTDEIVANPHLNIAPGIGNRAVIEIAAPSACIGHFTLSFSGLEQVPIRLPAQSI
jgi:hypothetical protein